MKVVLGWSRMSASLLLLALPAYGATHRPTAQKTHRHASVRHSGSRKSSHAVAHSSAVPMPTERATAIQTALIRQGYLTGEPSGEWDPQTVSAMEKLQADNGWQHKITPDSRALIKLGLGPTVQVEPTYVVPAPPH